MSVIKICEKIKDKTSVLVEINEAPVKNYAVPKIDYKKQRVMGVRSVISLGKIMRAYGDYLKKLEAFSTTDDTTEMAISFLKIKKFKSYFKGCYSSYESNKDDFDKVVQIANKFYMQERNFVGYGVYGFIQLSMRISNPLDNINKFFNDDKNKDKDELIIDGKTKKELIGSQNEFFELIGRNKLSDFDKDFFDDFKNLYNLANIIPDYINDKEGKFNFKNWLKDLLLVCNGKFILGLKNKIKSATDKAKIKLNINAEKVSKKIAEKNFVKNFIRQITSFEDKINYELLHNKKFHDNYNTERTFGNVFDDDFKKDLPVLSYKTLTSYEKCGKFLENKRMNKYFDEVDEYMEAVCNATYGINEKKYKERLKNRFEKGLLKKYKNEYGENAVKDNLNKYRGELTEGLNKIYKMPYNRVCDKSVLDTVKKEFEEFSKEAIKNIKELENTNE